MGRTNSAGCDCECDGCIEVVNLNLEVKHLVLGVRSLGPCRGFVPRLGLEVEAHAASRIANLNPPTTVACGDLPPEQTAVEGRQPLGVAAVDAYTRPAHSTTANQLRVKSFVHFDAFPVLEAAAGGSKVAVGPGSPSVG